MIKNNALERQIILIVQLLVNKIQYSQYQSSNEQLDSKKEH